MLENLSFGMSTGRDVTKPRKRLARAICAIRILHAREAYRERETMH